MRRKSLFRAAVLAFVLASASVAASAQVAGLYYKEVAKDGRIYVFNTADVLKLWEESGDMGKSITLIGRGENGETLVAENETAADLYFFRHNLEGYDRPTPKPEKPPFAIGYKDGKTTIETKSAKVSFQNRAQIRFTNVNPGAPGDTIGSFRVRRFHTIFEGNVYEYWKVKFQANWTSVDVVNDVTLSGTTLTRTRTRGPALDDAEIEYERYHLATIWAGQGKAFFGRQELTSDTRLQFVDRSIASERFAVKRDQGIALKGADQGKHFEYQVGLYNGNGPNQAGNDNKEYATVERLVWTPFGEYKLEDSALDYPTTPKLAIGVSAYQNTRGTGTAKADVNRTGVEAAFKIQGFNLGGEFFKETVDPKAAGPDVKTDGYWFQAGYLFPNKRFELAARQSLVSPDVTGPSQDQTETGIAASWYWDKHTHKIQADYREIETDRNRITTKDKELRLQLQLVF